jgi:probable F420-dependent oxidoreductase
MKIGVLGFLTEQSGDPGAMAREAENLGFESIWFAEHLVMPTNYTTYYPRGAGGKVPEVYAHLIDPFVALAIAAHATSRIRIGTGICLLPERNVIETAKVTASIDLYSKGRLTLGIGAGWFPEEAAIMGVNFPRRWQHLRESVEALRTLWGKDDVGYDGEIVKFPPVRLYPKPVQKPHPPVLLGVNTPNARDRVVEYADGWFPLAARAGDLAEGIADLRRRAEKAGRDPASLSVSVFGAKGDEATLRGNEKAGAERTILGLPSASRDEILPLLDQYARLMRAIA